MTRLYNIVKYVYILHIRYVYFTKIDKKTEVIDPRFVPLAAKFLPSPLRRFRLPTTSRPAPSATTFEPLASWLPMRGTKDPALSGEEAQRIGGFHSQK